MTTNKNPFGPEFQATLVHYDAYMAQDFRKAHEQRLILLAISFGLPATATQAEVHEASRKKLATEQGLPSTTTWAALYEFFEEQERKLSAQQCGLPETATWPQINLECARLAGHLDGPSQYERWLQVPDGPSNEAPWSWP